MSTETLLTPSIISKDSLTILANNLVMAGRVNRQFEEQMGAKIGTQLTIRKPNKFLVSEGAGLAVQDINEPSTSITITNQSHIDFQFGTAALTLVIEEFRERYLKPAMEKLANRIDRGGAGQHSKHLQRSRHTGYYPECFFVHRASRTAPGRRSSPAE